MRKKIVHIITGLSDGGAEAILFRFCFTDDVNKHIVISLKDEGKYGPLLKDAGFEVFTLNMQPNSFSIKAFYSLYKILLNKEPDVVQTWMYHADLIGGIISRFAGIKNVIWGIHNTTLIRGKSRSSTILISKINCLFSYLLPRKIIYCAQKSREVQELIGFNKRIGVVIPNGYRSDDFTPNMSFRSSFRNLFKLHDDTFLIGHVGRFDPQKDHKNLIEAISYLVNKELNFKVVLVGTDLDCYNEKLKEWIKKFDLEKFFILCGPRNDISKVMNGIDLFVLSSSYGEAFPNVLNESMACGTPCVTTDVGDSGLIVGNTGWIVPPKDPKSMANAILHAIDEKSAKSGVWQERKVACRERIVENYSIEKMISSYKKVWFG